ncbi:hypothetical protein L6E12_21485, partial [Actinokineospora sp. PR83]|uniref:hypothetical protein n=1 Tax=Actinokineospora sp. PR83 TaxID=2884908 RepID=UPI001F2137DE
MPTGYVLRPSAQAATGQLLRPGTRVAAGEADGDGLGGQCRRQAGCGRGGGCHACRRECPGVGGPGRGHDGVEAEGGR